MSIRAGWARALGLSVMLASCCWPATSDAQPTDNARSAARRLGEEGVALYRRGEYADALDKLTRAETLVGAPSLSVWAARSLVKLGRLVEANERYLAATRYPLDEAELGPARSAVQKKAQAEAQAERAELKPRIPVLVIAIAGPAADVQVTLDGAPVSGALLGVGQPVDPGPHELVATSGGQEQRKQVKLEERANERVEFSFEAPKAAAPVGVSAPAPTPPPTSPAGPSKSSIPEDQGGGGSRFLPAYIAFAVGGAGLVFGGVTGFLAVQKQGDLDSSCPDKSCPPANHADVDSYDSMRTFSTIGFAVGLVGAATGLVLVLTAPDEPALSAQISPGGISFRGQF